MAESLGEAGARPQSLRRLGLGALMAVIAANVWIGGPLFALWVGARLQETTGESLTIRPTTALAVFATLGVVTVLLTRALRVVSTAYDRTLGIGERARPRVKWLGTQERTLPQDRPPLSALERILVVMVAVAAILFEIWFLFYSTSPIDSRSGRTAAPLASAWETSRGQDSPSTKGEPWAQPSTSGSPSRSRSRRPLSGTR